MADALLSKMVKTIPDILHNFESIKYHRNVKFETMQKIKAAFESALKPETSDIDGKKMFTEFAHPGVEDECLLCKCTTKDGTMKTFYWVEPVNDDPLTDEQRAKIIERYTRDYTEAEIEFNQLIEFISEFKTYTTENNLVIGST